MRLATKYAVALGVSLALALPKFAAGRACVTGDGFGTLADVLTVLKVAVGQDIDIATCSLCGCGDGVLDSGEQCDDSNTWNNDGCSSWCRREFGGFTSAELTITSSDLDYGWKGLSFGSHIFYGSRVTLRMLKRCTDDNGVCVQDSDCLSGLCVPTPGGQSGSVYELAGPTHQARCLTTLDACNADADCPVGSCERFLGPPLPLTNGGVPACVTTFFAGDLSGTVDFNSGTWVSSAELRSRIHLGIFVDGPCPRCGGPASNPRVGDVFFCEGGPNAEAACTVEAASPDFGGVSNDCPPDPSSNVSGSGVVSRLLDSTTATRTRTARLPCNGISFQGCTDTFAPCSSNADCTGGPAGNKASCNFFCHCGFCDGDATFPCMEDQDCPQGTTCVAGPGTEAANLPQELPNQCANVQCGRDALEECHDTVVGECSGKDFLSCSNDSECQNQGAGTCVFKQKPCFENTITRIGAPSPLGKYCVDDSGNNALCTDDNDCAVGSCVDDSSKPTTVALFCVPATASAAINNATGIPGPGAITFESRILVCRCGDSNVGCDEQCDDGNTINGDGCDENCQVEP